MDKESAAAVISGVIGIVGVFVGSLISVIQAAISAWIKQRKDSAYLAILVVAHLDRLAMGCMGVALDDGTEYGRPAGQDGVEYVPTTTAPEFKPLDIGVDWKVLPRDLMYAILELPGKRERIENRLADIAEHEQDFPEYTEWFWARQRDYADFGLEVSSVAKRLRRHAGMPVDEPKAGEWSRDGQLREVLKKVDEERARHELRHAKYWASQVSNPATLPTTGDKQP